MSQPVRWQPPGLPVAHDATPTGWGRKRSGLWASRQAARNGSDLLLLEDGFLRSVGMGDAPLSVLRDDCGIYYDCRQSSRLERLIGRSLDECSHRRAVALIEQWRAARVSKYNDVRSAEHRPGPPYVLVVDQTWNDASVRYGSGSPEAFQRMLEAALDENPHARVLVKTHPAVLSGKRRGYLNRLTAGEASRIELIGQSHLPDLLEHADTVYTVTSQAGFEALMWGRPVRTFGMPFYAGWGLTSDEQTRPARRTDVALTGLVHAALIDYPVYRKPGTAQLCEVEDTIAHLGRQRRMRGRFPRHIEAIGFSRWKRPIAKAFFSGSRLDIRPAATTSTSASTVAVWGRRAVEVGQTPDRQVIRVEDGFLRSVGLGAALVRPLSWVQDDIGIYYDATRPSRLEAILADYAFDDALRLRARRIRERIVANGISKYNLGGLTFERPRTSRKIILVPGQVESDASLKFGSPQVTTNAALLEAVRRAEPDAFLIYKMHPDVAAGLRGAPVAERSALTSLCDVLITDRDTSNLVDSVDEVHTMTSLLGFEALLRSKPVVTYGLPFYAGWGLTVDRLSTPRRHRQLTLDELVAGALLLYPTYVSPVSGDFIEAEEALDLLLEWRRSASGEGLHCRNTLLRVIYAVQRRARANRST